jgi:hypothetical protein
MGATKIMVIRHGEKPDQYPYDNQPTQYFGVNNVATEAKKNGREHMVTLGWARAGGLITLFAPPWGPRSPDLATPAFLFASNPDPKPGDDTSDHGPSQRPYETLMPLGARLGLKTSTQFRKNHYAKMVEAALACDGVVLIAWQHQDIPMLAQNNVAGISSEILQQTGTTATFDIPQHWPNKPDGTARYDLVFVFDRPSGNGPITGFTLFAQQLLAGDLPA